MFCCVLMGEEKISLQNESDRQRLRDEMNEVIIKLFIWLIEKCIAVFYSLRLLVLDRKKIISDYCSVTIVTVGVCAEGFGLRNSDTLLLHHEEQPSLYWCKSRYAQLPNLVPKHIKPTV
jgi:hypothetical protein